MALVGTGGFTSEQPTVTHNTGLQHPVAPRAAMGLTPERFLRGEALGAEQLVRSFFFLLVNNR